MVRNSIETSSAGHKLGQFIGNWFEEYFVLPLLTEVATKLHLFLDNRFIDRPARGEKIVWQDEEGNSVDYDFVLELNGSDITRGIPVAFMECFWRRGSRHSKDKARDDSGKLTPMRAAYPTARFLGIISAGDFTEPARDLVRSKDIDLFYVPKNKVVEAFLMNGLIMDYPDSAPESEKKQLASEFEASFTFEKRRLVSNTLIELVGKAAVGSYVDRVRAKLSALPQEIRLALRREAASLVFKSVSEVTTFLEKPEFYMDKPRQSYLYEITYSDGSEFEQIATSIDDLKALHEQICTLTNHVIGLSL